VLTGTSSAGTVASAGVWAIKTRIGQAIIAADNTARAMRIGWTSFSIFRLWIAG
jgi:hypothetical protein